MRKDQEMSNWEQINDETSHVVMFNLSLAYGRNAGDKFCVHPKKQKQQTATTDSDSVPQVTPPFPSHPIFGAASR